ncbi:MAG: DUF6092 family protein [Anaerolineae bacterium]|nr:DUF6092 family protein [Anaerolineae bacterium]
MMAERLVISEENFYELLSFMVTSAHLSVEEPELYGSFRLIDGACRLIRFALDSGQLRDEQFVREFKEYADVRKHWMMTDEPGFLRFLEEATGKLAAELKRQALEG